MSLNPYASPGHDGSKMRVGTLLLKLVALCLWLLSLFLVLGIATTWNRPEIVERSKQAPTLAAVIWVVGFVLPAAGFALLGFASWFRRRSIALVGCCTFLPLVLFFLYFAFRRP